MIFCGISGYAQNNNTSSPYSRFGLGDISPYGFGRSAAMGGATLGSRHALQINSANPASYNGNDSLSFIFDFGVDGTFSRYKSNSGSRKTNNINFRYFSLAFPVTKWMGAGFGLQPYSDMGYDVGFTVIDPLSGIGNTSQRYSGQGTTSKAYFGASVRPLKGLSIGANLNYIFGRLSKNTLFQFADASAFTYTKTEGIRLRDFTLTYGLQYDLELKKNQYLTLGVTFERQSDFTILYQSLALVGGTDTIQGSSEAKAIMKMPSTYGVGLSYNHINKLEINADYYHAGWSKAAFPGKMDQMITDQNRYSAGVEYIPDATSIRSYMKKVKYRAGIHHEDSYLMINNHQITENGVSFGLGLPFPKSKSTANFAIEVGEKGTTDYSLVKNNYTKVSLYLNFYDYWFIKRKFD